MKSSIVNHTMWQDIQDSYKLGQIVKVDNPGPRVIVDKVEKLKNTWAIHCTEITHGHKIVYRVGKAKVLGVYPARGWESARHRYV